MIKSLDDQNAKLRLKVHALVKQDNGKYYTDENARIRAKIHFAQNKYDKQRMLILNLRMSKNG